jgi:hypothetical protein
MAITPRTPEAAGRYHGPVREAGDRPPGSSPPEEARPRLEAADPFRPPLVPPGGLTPDAARAYAIRRKCWDQLSEAMELPDASGPPMLNVPMEGIAAGVGLLGLALLLPMLSVHPYAVLAVTLPVAVAVVLLASITIPLFGRVRGQQNWTDRLVVDRWADYYRQCYASLDQSDLALTVVDDGRFLEGFPAQLRHLLLGRTYSFSERLVQAASFWELLAAGDAAHPHHSLPATLEFSTRIKTLHSLAGGGWAAGLGRGSVRLDTYVCARYAALYDFFHGAGAAAADSAQ